MLVDGVFAHRAGLVDLAVVRDLQHCELTCPDLSVGALTDAHAIVPRVLRCAGSAAGIGRARASSSLMSTLIRRGPMRYPVRRPPAMYRRTVRTETFAYAAAAVSVTSWRRPGAS